MRKKKETYKTKHPIIKEISIGDKFVCDNGDIVELINVDKFVTEDGTIVELINVDEKDVTAPFRFNNYYWYTLNLKFWRAKNVNNVHPLDIKHKYIPFKDKIDLL